MVMAVQQVYGNLRVAHAESEFYIFFTEKVIINYIAAEMVVCYRRGAGAK